MARKYTYIVDGTEYSGRELCKKWQLSRDVLTRYMAVNNLMPDALTATDLLYAQGVTTVKTVWEDPPYTLGGVSYTSLDAIADACFTPVDDLRSYIERKYAGRVTYALTLTDSLPCKIFRKNGILYANVRYKIGYHYESVSSACGGDDLQRRLLENGGNLNSVVKGAQEARNKWRSARQGIIVCGKHYATYTRLYKELDITSATWRERAAKVGEEEAYKYFIKRKARKENEGPLAVVKGVPCHSLSQVAKAIDAKVNLGTFTEYVRAHSLQEAIEHYSGDWENRARGRYVVGDQCDLAWKAALTAAHTSAGVVENLMASTGMSEQEALTVKYNEWLAKGREGVFRGKKYFKVTDIANDSGQRVMYLQTVIRQGRLQFSQICSLLDAFDRIPRFINLARYVTLAEDLDGKYLLSLLEQHPEFIDTKGNIERTKVYNLISNVDVLIYGQQFIGGRDISRVLEVTQCELCAILSNNADPQTAIDEYLDSLDSQDKHKALHIALKFKGLYGITPVFKSGAFGWCKQCGRELLLPLDVAKSHLHGTQCSKYWVPQGVALPARLHTHMPGRSAYGFSTLINSIIEDHGEEL